MTRLSDRGVAVGLGVGLVALVLLMGGWNDLPMNDDFSYARLTEQMARQGRLVLNGWGTPLMLPQIALGALLIKLLGFSYQLLHLVGLACAGLAAPLVYLLGRACRLERWWALTIALILGLSPFYLGTAPTYLTDLPATALGMGSLLLLVRSLGDEGQVDRRRLIAAGVLGLVAGAERQALWLPFLGALAVVAFLVPRARPLAAGFAVAILAIGYPLVRWFDRQPYSVPVSFGDGFAMILAVPAVAFRFVYKFLNVIGLFVLPFALPALRGKQIRWLLMGALLLFALLPPFHPMGTRNMDVFGEKYMLTYYGQYFTSHGIVVGGVDGFARRAAILPPTVILLLTVAGAVGVATGGYLLMDGAERLGARRKAGTVSTQQVAVTALAVYGIIQVAAFVPWLAQMNVFDRYLLPLLPCLLIVHAAQSQSARLPRALAAVPLVFAALYGLYGIGSAIEYFGLTRARQTLYRRLLARGVAPTQIDGGFELVADAQVVAQERVGPSNPPEGSPVGHYLAYLPERFPAIDARWRLSTDPDYSEVNTPAVDEVTWFSPLPPTTRRMAVYPINRPD